MLSNKSSFLEINHQFFGTPISRVANSKKKYCKDNDYLSLRLQKHITFFPLKMSSSIRGEGRHFHIWNSILDKVMSRSQ